MKARQSHERAFLQLTKANPSERPSQRVFSSRSPKATSRNRDVLDERRGGAVVTTKQRLAARIRYLEQGGGGGCSVCTWP